MPRHEAIEALEIYKRAARLQPPRSFPSTMEEYIREAPNAAPSSNSDAFQANNFDSTGWELALVTTPSSNISASSRQQLAGGFDSLTLIEFIRPSRLYTIATDSLWNTGPKPI